MPTAEGKQTASILSLNKPPFASSRSLRSPCGPSLTIVRSIPKRGQLRICQESSPVRSAAFSSSVIWLMISGIVMGFSLLSIFSGKQGLGLCFCDLARIAVGHNLHVFIP